MPNRWPFLRISASLQANPALLLGYVAVSLAAPLAVSFAAPLEAPVVAVAEPGASEPSASQKSVVRLLTSGGLVAGHYMGGVEIRLAPGAITYWRNPGDAGVPPVFSFSGSTNLATVQVKFPAPLRIDEAGLEAIGYRDKVVFPLDIAPRDPRKAVNLALNLQYAVCEKICVPAQATAHLMFSPGAARTLTAPLVAAALNTVPQPAGRDGAPKLVVERLTRDKPTWRVRIEPEPVGDTDVFAEAPEGWYFDTRRAPDGFELQLAQKPAEANAAIDTVLTFVAGARAFEQTVRLDVASATP